MNIYRGMRYWYTDINIWIEVHTHIVIGITIAIRTNVTLSIYNNKYNKTNNCNNIHTQQYK